MFKVGDTVVVSGFKNPKRNGTWPVTEVRPDGLGIRVNGLMTATPPHCAGDIRLVDMPGVKTGRMSCGAFEVGDKVVTDRPFAADGVYTIKRLQVDDTIASLVHDTDRSVVHVNTTSLSAAGDHGFKVGDVVVYQGGKREWTLVSTRQESREAFNIIAQNGDTGIVYADEIVKVSGAVIANEKFVVGQFVTTILCAEPCEITSIDVSSGYINLKTPAGETLYVMTSDMTRVPTAGAVESTGCECGSGSDVHGRIHSEWCRCYET